MGTCRGIIYENGGCKLLTSNTTASEVEVFVASQPGDGWQIGNVKSFYSVHLAVTIMIKFTHRSIFTNLIDYFKFVENFRKMIYPLGYVLNIMNFSEPL